MTKSSFLVACAILAVTLSACQANQAADPADAASEPGLLVYVGTGTGDPAEGIYTYRFDPATGALTQAGEVTPVLNPTYLTPSADGRFVYSISETDGTGSASAFQVDPESGALTLINQQSTEGDGPAYISTDAEGDWVLVANYMGGSVAVLPVADDGSLGEAADVVQHTGSGPNKERQEAPHAHYIHMDPTNRYAFATDLGIDQVRIYELDAATGSLHADAARAITTAPGAGPRHLDFHPNGRYLYLINELNGTVSAYTYDGDTGETSEIQTISSLPAGFDGLNKSADIHVHPSGRFLYASNRGDFDSIAIYAIDEATGRLTLVGHQTEQITWPRNFAIDPSGAYLLVANRQADSIVVFAIDQATGRLTPTGHTVTVPQPTCIKFVPPAT